MVKLKFLFLLIGLSFRSFILLFEEYFSIKFKFLNLILFKIIKSEL